MTAGFCGQSTLAQGLPNKGAGSLLQTTHLSKHTSVLCWLSSYGEMMIWSRK